jgi:membrane protease YdiL (CAAX protease family)
VVDSAFATERVAWSWWRLIWYSAIVGFVYIATQLVVIIPVVATAMTRPHFDIKGWAYRAGSDGFILSLTTCAAALTCVPLLGLLTGRRETRPWDFLGLRSCPTRHIILSCGAMAAFIAASDWVSVTVGRPSASPFMREMYASARFPTLLLVTLVVAAPILEELFFRGFLFGGLLACGAPVQVTVAAVSAAFAALHSQYDAYDVTWVFLMGLLLVGARVKFDSIVPCIAMHSIANAVAFVELALKRAA